MSDSWMVNRRLSTPSELGITMAKTPLGLSEDRYVLHQMCYDV